MYRRPKEVNAIREEGRIPLLQIDANVNPGNSGGPVLNDRGEVVGVVVSKLNAPFFLQETGTIPERVNFAIPIDEARGIVRKAYPLEFTPSAKTEHLTGQQIFDGARKATVLIIASRTAKPALSAAPSAPLILSNQQATAAFNWLRDRLQKPHAKSVSYDSKTDCYIWIGPKYGKRMSMPRSQFGAEIWPDYIKTHPTETSQ